jgi:hypothetical protein
VEDWLAQLFGTIGYVGCDAIMMQVRTSSFVYDIFRSELSELFAFLLP